MLNALIQRMISDDDNCGIVITDNHIELGPYIRSKANSGCLPRRGMTVVHFDASPDLDSPMNFLVDSSGNVLNSTVDHRECWLLPLIYQGYICKLVWFKPPWSAHLLDGIYEFLVGACKETRRIKCSCKDNYFVFREIFCPAAQLINPRPLRLIVATVGIPGNYAFLHHMIHQSFTDDQVLKYPYPTEECDLRCLVNCKKPCKEDFKVISHTRLWEYKYYFIFRRD
ncbi:hypothetical protein ACOME3_009654 [Neoechinorhynchus agilis]